VDEKLVVGVGLWTVQTSNWLGVLVACKGSHRTRFHVHEPD